MAPKVDEDGTGQYQGSQAFAHVLSGQTEFITPNTGSLNISHPIVSLRGKRSSIDFNLSLSYGDGMLGTLGLPDNWGFNVAYVLPEKTLTIDGRTYIIDFDWVDSTGYRSGLKFVNDRGLKFKKIEPPLPLPSGRGTEYGYRLQTSEGSSYYFDVYGKLWEQYDLFQNHILYSFVEAEDSDVLNMALDRIQDSWDLLVTFKYEPSSESPYANMTITMPDGGTAVISRTDGGVGTVRDPEGLQTNFVYISGEKILTEIDYASGLISKFEYTQLAYKDLENNTRYKYAIKDHFHRDQAANTLYEHTGYTYGDGTDEHTYTGYAIGLQMGGLQDRVMEGNTQTSDYLYDVYQTKYDEAGQPLAATSTTFNSLHLPITEDKLLLNSLGTFDPVYRSTFKYANDLDFARTTNYARPQTIQQSHNVSVGGTVTYRPMSNVKMNYNEFGNVVCSEEIMYTDSSDQEYTLQKITTKTWYTVDMGLDHKMQIEESDAVQDMISSWLYQTDHQLSANQRTIGSSTVQFIDGSDVQRQLKPWKEQAFTYDDNGRLLSETSRWSSGTVVPDGSVPSTTITHAYSFSDGILTEKKTDALQNTTMVNYDVRIRSGPVVSNVLPLGQRESYKYDKVGRLVVRIDALGYTTQTEYSVGVGKNTEKTTDPLGYAKLSVMDGMGRVIKVMDNGDPTQSSTELSRIVSQTSYDALSRVQDETNMLNLKTSYKYDSLGRQLEMVDPDGNVVRYEYDDVQLTTTERLNGDLRSISTRDGSSRLCHQIKYPDSGDSSMTYSLQMDLLYNGLGRQTLHTISHAPLNGSQPATVLSKTTREYDAESAMIVQAAMGVTADGEDAEHRRYVLDLFGNTYSYVKTTKFSDGRSFSVDGPVSLYDATNRLIAVRNQLGQEERSTYNANGLRTENKRFDGTETSYVYDAAGQVIKIVSPSSAAEMTYAAFGRLSQVTRNENTMKYAYSRDGTLVSTIYSDGRSQKYCLDQYSRVVMETDPFGIERTTNFNASGRASDRRCNGDTVTYVYGKAINCYNMLVGFDVNGTQSYHRSLMYDGFGQIKQSSVTAQDSTNLLDTRYARSHSQRLQSVHSTSAVTPELNSTREFIYNGLGQVVQNSSNASTASTTKYTYDGNSNVLSLDVDGKASQMNYNKIDQRADAGFQYDINGRMVKDDKGRKYIFSDDDHLLSIQDGSSTKVTMGYHADESLAAHQSGNSSSKFFHSFDTINAVETTNPDHTTTSSLFADDNQLIAGYSTSAAPCYFLDQQSSTALLLEDKNKIALTYEAYGSRKPSAPLPIQSSFGYRQEFTDPVFGFLYLRSRFYDPGLMAFVSMDKYRTENRYAYCEGDPINLFDPSGHAPEWLAWAVGITVGVAVAVLTGGMAVAAAGALGAEALTASLVGATVGGALGNVAGGAAQAIISGSTYGGREALTDLAAGAIGGLLGGAGGAIGARVTGQLGSMAIGALAGSISSAGVYAAVTGQPISIEGILFNAALGFGIGAVGAHFGYKGAQAMVQEAEVAAAPAQAQAANANANAANANANPVANAGPAAQAQHPLVMRVRLQARQPQLQPQPQPQVQVQQPQARAAPQGFGGRRGPNRVMNLVMRRAAAHAMPLRNYLPGAYFAI